MLTSYADAACCSPKPVPHADPTRRDTEAVCKGVIAVPKQALDAVPYQMADLVVKMGSSLVEDNNVRVSKQCPQNCDDLSLTS